MFEGFLILLKKYSNFQMLFHDFYDNEIKIIINLLPCELFLCKMCQGRRPDFFLSHIAQP